MPPAPGTTPRTAQVVPVSTGTLTGGVPPLHTHSYYSLRAGASSLTALVQAALDGGAPALALTDRNAMYGLMPFLAACREADLPALIGCELDDPADARIRAVCWARTRRGFALLSAVVTRRCLTPEQFDLAAECAAFDPAHIWAGTSHLPLLTAVAARRSPSGWVALVYPGRQRGNHPDPGLVQAVAGRLGLLSALASDAWVARPAELPTQHLLLRIASRYTEQTPGWEALRGTRDTVIWSREESARWSARYPLAARGALLVAEQCGGVSLTRERWVMPPWTPPPGLSAASALTERAWAGLYRRFGPYPPGNAIQRLGYELEVICGMEYAPYFHVVADLVEQARAWGIVALGRGSVADSLTAYCLGLSEVDPLRYDLYFERFLNPSRKSPPDMDIDFSWKERDRVLDFLFTRFGDAHGAMVGCFHTLHARGAYRETALALGLSANDVALSTQLPYTSATRLTRLQEQYPESAGLPLDTPHLQPALEHAARLAGIPLSTGMHPCGLVLTPEPLTDYGPLERCHKGYRNTHFDMHAVEDIGLVKIDILATRGLGTVDTVRAALRERRTADPLDAGFDTYAAHPGARRILRQGRTLGCFYTESPAMISLNQKVTCSTYAHLIATSSVIRPGVAESGMMDSYIRRHRGEERVTHLHALLGELLPETYGVMIYQEDVLKVAHLLGGMPLADADLLRRAMSGKERSPIRMAPLRERFLRAAIGERGIAPVVAEEIWRQIESFAGYAFCKGHSAAFAQVSLQTCRLKVEDPATFMAAVLSNEGGFYTPHVYLEEARRLGLRISGPDVNGSRWDYWGYGTALRVGLRAIKGLYEEAGAHLVRVRDGRPFTSVNEFLDRACTGPGALPPSQVELLILAGALDSLGLPRPGQYAALIAHTAREQARRDGGTLPLFPPPPDRAGPQGDWSRDQRYAAMLDLLGFLPAMHPLDWLKDRLPPVAPGPPLIEAQALPQHAGQQVRIRGLGVTRKLVTTRNGRERMAFLSLEDPTGIAEVTLFPRAYRAAAARLRGWGPFVITGRIERQYGVCSLTAERVERIELAGTAAPEVWSRLPWSNGGELQAGLVGGSLGVTLTLGQGSRASAGSCGAGSGENEEVAVRTA